MQPINDSCLGVCVNCASAALTPRKPPRPSSPVAVTAASGGNAMFAGKRVIAGLASAAVLAILTTRAEGQFREQRRPEVRGILKALDVSKGTLTVAFGEGRDAAGGEKT